MLLHRLPNQAMLLPSTQLVPLPHETHRWALKQANNRGLHRGNLGRPLHPHRPRTWLLAKDSLPVDSTRENLLLIRMLEIWMCEMIYFSMQSLPLSCIIVPISLYLPDTVLILHGSIFVSLPYILPYIHTPCTFLKFRNTCLNAFGYGCFSRPRIRRLA